MAPRSHFSEYALAVVGIPQAPDGITKPRCSAAREARSTKWSGWISRVHDTAWSYGNKALTDTALVAGDHEVAARIQTARLPRDNDLSIRLEYYAICAVA